MGAGLCAVGAILGCVTTVRQFYLGGLAKAVFFDVA